MWFQTASKKQLGDLLERSSSSPGLFEGSEAPPDSPPRSGEFVLVWPNRPTAHEIPTAIVVENAQRRDLLGWAASFASSYRPLTAHVHILNFHTCNALLDKRRSRPTERGIGAAVGAILGEALATASQSSDLSVSECARTFAYAMGRTFALGLSELFEEVTSAWQVFSAITNHTGDRRRDLQHQRWPWMALAAAAGVETISITDPRLADESAGAPKDGARVLKELYATSEISEPTLISLKSRWPALEPILPLLRETREVRVHAFQSFAQELVNTPRTDAGDAGEMPFVLGYVASRLAPGSLEYFRLLRPLEQHLPGLLVWYGICAALQGDDFIATSGGLGRRLHRDLSAAEMFPGRPHADISVWDLEVFARSGASPLSLIGSASYGVELVPDIVCVGPAGAMRSTAETPRQMVSSRTEGAMSTHEIKSLLEELKQALGRVSNVQYKLDRLTGGSGTTQPAPKSRLRK